MKKFFLGVALACAALLSACGPRIDYGQCLSSHVEDHPPSLSYEPTVGGMGISGGIAVGGSTGGFALVMKPGYSETVCDQYEFPEGRRY